MSRLRQNLDQYSSAYDIVQPDQLFAPRQYQPTLGSQRYGIDENKGYSRAVAQRNFMTTPV